jgi:hypothetical protein
VQVNMAAYFIEVLVKNKPNKPIGCDILRKDDVAEMLGRATCAYKPSSLVDTEPQTDRLCDIGRDQCVACGHWQGPRRIGSSGAIMKGNGNVHLFIASFVHSL